MTYLAKKLGCEYASLPDNNQAKSANSNHKIAKPIYKIIAVFDAEFVSTNVTVNNLAKTLNHI